MLSILDKIIQHRFRRKNEGPFPPYYLSKEEADELRSLRDNSKLVEELFEVPLVYMEADNAIDNRYLPSDR